MTLDVCAEILATRHFFGERGITDAVVGYSGGIDSTVTALLLSIAGVHVHLVAAEAPNQKYSSPMGGAEGARILATANCAGPATVHHHTFTYPFPMLAIRRAANEAALPILRNAIFYGVAAELRDHGKAAAVVGTANFSEAAFLGFWGKASDGAQDMYPISHLSKEQVYELAAALGAPRATIHAAPSGDLLFENSNDYSMIGATYDEIEAIIYHAEGHHQLELTEAMDAVSEPQKFAEGIVRNQFKYELPFPGFHANDRLERFRVDCYQPILQHATAMQNFVVIR